MVTNLSCWYFQRDRDLWVMGKGSRRLAEPPGTSWDVPEVMWAGTRGGPSQLHAIWATILGLAAEEEGHVEEGGHLSRSENSTLPFFFLHTDHGERVLGRGALLLAMGPTSAAGN